MIKIFTEILNERQKAVLPKLEGLTKKYKLCALSRKFLVSSSL